MCVQEPRNTEVCLPAAFGKIFMFTLALSPYRPVPASVDLLCVCVCVCVRAGAEKCNGMSARCFLRFVCALALALIQAYAYRAWAMARCILLLTVRVGVEELTNTEVCLPAALERMFTVHPCSVSYTGLCLNRLTCCACVRAGAEKYNGMSARCFLR